MLKKKAGRIINISSVVGQIGNPGQVLVLLDLHYVLAYGSLLYGGTGAGSLRPSSGVGGYGSWAGRALTSVTDGTYS